MPPLIIDSDICKKEINKYNVRYHNYKLMITIQNLKIDKNSRKLKEYQNALKFSLDKLTPEQREEAMKPTIKSPLLLKAIEDNKNPFKRVFGSNLELKC